MSVEWEDLRSELIDAGDEEKVARHSARMVAEERAHRLAEARKRRHVTQRGLAEAMGVSQARVSAIERGHITQKELSTLAAYVAALGGKLEIVADFGDEKLTLG